MTSGYLNLLRSSVKAISNYLNRNLIFLKSDPICYNVHCFNLKYQVSWASQNLIRGKMEDFHFEVAGNCQLHWKVLL